DHRFCLTTLVACNHEPGVTLRAIANNGRQIRTRDLEHDHRPDQAVAALRAALADFPRDWRIQYRLARALRIVNRPEEARREAETVGRIREVLDPLTLGPKLDAAFAHLDEPAAFATLANLCAGAGLTRLAGVWRTAGAPSVGRSPMSHVPGCRLADACNGIPDRLPVGRPGLPQSNKAGGKESLTGLSAIKCHPGLSVLV
ncbi:MAG: tetratricopeptide repeat protein, partial [Isosphaeraceae bacterium]